MRTKRRGVVVATLLALALVAAGCARAPYTTDVRTTSASVSFASFAATPTPEVRFSEAGGSCRERSAPAGAATQITVAFSARYQFHATLTGLQPETEYCYRVFQGGQDLLGDFPSGSFRTAPSPGDASPVTFAVVGDWGAGTVDQSRVFGQIASSPAQFVVTTGDNEQTTGSQNDYGDVQRGRVFPLPYFPVVGIQKPVFPVIGNHDMDVGSSGGLPFLQNFPQAETVAASNGRYRQETYCCMESQPEPVRLTSAWYAFDWGPARFYMLQAAWPTNPTCCQYRSDFEAHWSGPVPGCGPCGAQRAWLEADLAAHQSTPIKFAFFHYPLRTDSEPIGDRFLNGAAALEGTLARNGVKIAFNGHAHVYQRNLPQIAGTPMVNYVTGGGGAELGTITGCRTFNAYAIGLASSCRAPVPTSPAQVFHFLLVRVEGRRVTVTPTDSTGRTFDVQSYDF